MKDINSVMSYAKRTCLRVAAADAASGLPRNVIVRDANLSQTTAIYRGWRPKGWFITHCAHDKVVWERCGVCKRTSQSDIQFAVRSMFETLKLIEASQKGAQ